MYNGSTQVRDSHLAGSPATSVEINTVVSPAVPTLTKNSEVSPLSNENCIGAIENMENMEEMTLNLWNPHDMFVVTGPTTFMECPFGPLSIVQYDPYTRALCGSIHGTTITDWHNHLRSPSTAVKDNSKKTSEYDVQTELGCFSFIEKAIVKYIEISNIKAEKPSSLQLVYDEQKIGNCKNSLRSRFTRSLFGEIETFLSDIEDIDTLLKGFYENIYPFYPFMDIDSFENDLKAIFLKSQEQPYELNIKNLNARQRLETLTLFLIIIGMSIKASVSQEDINSIRKTSASEKSDQLNTISSRLLCVMNSFARPNENTFCCLLYLYTTQYLDPDDLSIIATHSSVLELKNLHQIAIALGLHQQPSNFTRLVDKQNEDLKLLNLRWKLWVGLQCLKFQAFIPDGAVNKFDLEYMQVFLGDDDEIASSFRKSTYFSYEFDNSHVKVLRKKYTFSMLLARLISSCTPISGYSNLKTIVQNIKNSEDFMRQEFPLLNLSIPPITKQSNDTNTFWRNADLNLEAVENVEILIANIVGNTCFMNVYLVISLYFEKKCLNDWEMYEEKYQAFTLKSFKAYFQLLTITTDYLSGAYNTKPKGRYGYVVNKLMSNIMVKIWIMQCSILLRITFKQFMLQSYRRPHSEYNVPPSEYGSIIDELLSSVRHHMSNSLDLATKCLHDFYLGSYFAIPMFKYIVYMVDIGRLVSITNRFWENVACGEAVPEQIKRVITLKWGLDVDDSEHITDKLMSSRMLRSFNTVLLIEIEKLFKRDKLHGNVMEHFSETAQEIYIEQSENEILKQFLESNFEEFMDSINSV